MTIAARASPPTAARGGGGRRAGGGGGGGGRRGGRVRRFNFGRLLFNQRDQMVDHIGVLQAVVREAGEATKTIGGRGLVSEGGFILQA